MSDEANSFPPPSSPLVTIGVALHNEEASAASLVSSLALLSSPKILVLDHCTDHTGSVIDSALDSLSVSQRTSFLIIHNDGPQGKKYAQRLLVEHAVTLYILATDADCMLSALWEQSVISYLQKHAPDLLLLPVGVHRVNGSLRESLFALDFLSLQISTMGCALSGKPTMANGANICFSRDLYLSHNANTQYVSGDDMFLLAEAKRLNKRVAYCLSPGAMVYTPMPSSWTAFLNQHARWFRKSSGYSDRDVIRLGWATFSATFLWPLLLFALPLSLQWITALMFIIKTTYELKLLRRAASFFSHPIRLCHVLFFACIYPVLTILIVLKAAVRSKRSW